MPDYIPTTWPQKWTWMNNFLAELDTATTNYTTPFLGVDYNTLGLAFDGIANVYFSADNLARTPSTRTALTIRARDEAWVAAEAEARKMAQLIQSSEGITDQVRENFAITVLKKIRTPVPPPTSNPILGLRRQGIGTVKLEYTDAEAPVGKAKPPGVTGVQIWGRPPAGSEELMGTFTKSPQQIATTRFVSGTLVVYRARYVTRSGPAGVGQLGPWSPDLALITS